MVPTCLTRSNDTFFFYNKFDHLNIFHSKGTFQGNLRTDKTSLKHTFGGGGGKGAILQNKDFRMSKQD